MGIALILFSSCVSRRSIPVPSITHQDIMHFIPDSPVIIYTTRGDYSQFVPVRMNSERTEIIYYPQPSDLHHNGQPALPVRLNQGFWLDNFGIGPDVAFLKFDYRQYMLLQTPPPVEIMMRYILDARPLLAMYQCGYRFEYKDLIHDLNVLIERGLTNCRRIPVSEYTDNNLRKDE